MDDIRPSRSRSLWSFAAARAADTLRRRGWACPISYVQAFALAIHTGTDAFKPDPTGELVRILREVADQIEAGREYDKSVPVHDINGNHVGSFMLVDEFAQREAKRLGLASGGIT